MATTIERSSRADTQNIDEDIDTDDEKIDEILLSDMNIHNQNIQRIYFEVSDGLEKKNTLGYDNSVNSLTNALHSLSNHETQLFLEKSFYKMVAILLDQNPSKIGGYERGKIEDSLDLSIRILAILLKQDDKYLDVLIKIFSRLPTYYAGSKTAWTNYLGDPHVRLSCIAKFHDLAGFDSIRNLMELQWLGAEKIQIILSALRDVDPSLTGSVSQSIGSLVMKQLLELPDDILKKENTESMSSIMSANGLLPKKESPEIQIKNFYKFWLDMTLKMMNCNSIVIKLFAWDQIQAIIKESRHTRPPANRYLVRNAGTDEVNGIYERNFKRGDVPLYLKKPEREGDNLFTLFRCTMRSKQKWWFISVADIEKPGTDKDIDYYQHKSTPEQDMEPPVLGWVVVSGANAHAIEPAPVLIRLETITDEQGEPITSLMDLLIAWSSENNLLERVFGYHSIHREIVSRSTALLTLLCDEDKLSEGDIQAIWKVGITNPSEETYSEVLTLLANSALHMSDTALDILVDLVLKTLDPASPSAPHNSSSIVNEQTYILKVAEFLDKIHYEGIKYIRCLTDHAKDRVIELVWKVYANPAVENYKNHNHIEDLLSICLRYHRNKDALLVSYLEECSASLSLFSPSSSASTTSTATTTSSSSSILSSTTTTTTTTTTLLVPQESVDEKKMSRYVRILEFLLNICGQHHDSSIEEFFVSTQFHLVLFNEVKRYVSTHCFSGGLSQVNSSVVSHAVKKRLHLLRIAYGVSLSIKLSIDQLKDLWSIFFLSDQIPISVKEEFLTFLRLAGVKETKKTYDSAFHIAECYSIFETMLCNPIVDWSLLSEDSYTCFQTYFSGLILKNDLERVHSIRMIGLNSLWKIILHISSETSAKEGITLLLSTYQDMQSYDTTSHQKLLDRIFSHYKHILEGMKSSNDNIVSTITQREISRCSDILNRLLLQSQTLSTTNTQEIPPPPHGVRGTISRIKITVKYREVVPSTTNYITVYNRRTPQMEKSPEKTAIIDISPHHTVAILKDKIRALATSSLNLHGAVPFGSSTATQSKRGVTLEYDHAFLGGDLKMLSEFGVTDGSVILATILQSQAVSAYDIDDYQETYFTPHNHHQHHHQSHSHQNSHSRSSYTSDNPLSLKKLFSYLTSTENFNCLMNLVQLLEVKQQTQVENESGIEFEETGRKVWDIIMSIPPQQDIYNSVKHDFNSSLSFLENVDEIDEDDGEEISGAAAEVAEGETNVKDRENVVDSDEERKETNDGLSLNEIQLKTEMWTLLKPSAIDPARATYILQIIDYTLQPAPELIIPGQEKQLSRFREGFFLSDGFVAVFNYFISSSNPRNSLLSKLSQSVALHIIHYCLHDPLTHEVNTFLIQQIQEISLHSSLLIEKFLLVAYHSAQHEETNILQRALETITSLLQITSLATQLTENRYSKSLLTSVLKNSSKVVRTMASNFAVEINKSQPVVIEWLIDEFEGMRYNDEYCYDIIQIINLLLSQMTLSSNQLLVEGVIVRLMNLIAVKLQLLQDHTSNLNPLTEFSRQTLLGCLELLGGLMKMNCALVISSSDFGRNLIQLLMNDYLFAISENGVDRLPLCDVAETRKAAFMVLQSIIQQWPKSDGVSPPLPLNEILLPLESLNQWAAMNIKHSWSIQTSYDLKRAGIPHLGLKNQGCTCYLNSLVQQLYMNVTLREIIMKAKIHKDYRSSLWHYGDEELVGCMFNFEWVGNNIWKRGKIVDYDPITRFHSVSYTSTAHDGSMNVTETCIFNIHTGRAQKETGRVRVIKEVEDGISERELSALYVLEQLQRLFCYLEKSKKRYFDPRTFIESCKTLNLNFNIYHQNDATEFYDQLLDRLETAMKGSYCYMSTWEDMKCKVFGGEMLAQKIPKDCSTYEENKSNCGHWQSTRKEGFLKTELLIRNKEKIEDSLSQLVEGELMDGDNKIMCDVCVEKKDTVRRTCFGTLPNLLVVHLKRFDLDFTTFETVKLNNRMSFPTTLDMFPYTKEGIEYYESLEQKQQQQQQHNHNQQQQSSDADADADNNVYGDGDGDHDADAGTEPPTPVRNSSKGQDESGTVTGAELGNSTSTVQEGSSKPDSTDYEYELQGVLVHSGIAQGGHYYSFIRENDDTSKWFLFDDDDVTHFNPENIPIQCFGGSYQTSFHGVSSMIEEDRSSNALMLFYKKKISRSQTKSDSETDSNSNVNLNLNEVKNNASEENNNNNVTQSSPPKPQVDELDYLDGYQAFDREINESNRRHMFINYLVDPHLHTFVRDLLKISAPPVSTLVLNEGCDGGGAVHDRSDAGDDIEMDTDSDLHESVIVTQSSDISSSQRMEVVKFTSNFFLNIVLHCRERNNMKLWITSLRDVFSCQSSAAVWLLRYLIGKNGSILREFFFHCGDAVARGTFVQLITAALTSLYNQDSEMLSDENCLLPYLACKPSEIIQLVTHNTNDVKALFAAVIFSILKLIPDLPTYLRSGSGDEVFHFIRDISIHIPPTRHYLIEKDVLATICYFVTPDTSSQSTKDIFLHSTSKFTPMDVKPFYPSIFEAIAGLLNLPQTQKVPLLVERNNIWDPELTPEAKEALSIIFKENSHFGGMDSRDIINYMDRVHESDDSVPKVTALQVRSILDRYDTTTDGTRLALSGFLRYYADTALYQPKSVWKDLKAFGFQNDLSRASSLMSDNTDLTLYPPLNLPTASREALLSFHLLEIGLESVESVAVAIVKRICWKELEISKTMCKMVLHRIKVILGDWSWNPAENLYLGLLRLFIKIDDGLLEDRLEEIIGGTEGLLTIIIYERSYPQRQVVNVYNHTHSHNHNLNHNHNHNQTDTRPLTHRYMDLLHEINHIPAVANWIQSKAATNDPNYQWLSSQLNHSHLTSVMSTSHKSKADILAASLLCTTIIVSGAGVWEINGIYTFQKILNQAGVFQKTTRYEDELVDVRIYRCHMQNNSLRWFISITPENRDPGTESDTDFYCTTGGGGGGGGRNEFDQEGCPPTSRWISVDRKYDPVPTLIISSSDMNSDEASHSIPRVSRTGGGGLGSNLYVDPRSRVGVNGSDDDDEDEEHEDDSDHEDSMAVIDDEYPYLNTSSTPGTPIDIPPSP